MTIKLKRFQIQKVKIDNSLIQGFKLNGQMNYKLLSCTLCVIDSPGR